MNDMSQIVENAVMSAAEKAVEERCQQIADDILKYIKMEIAVDREGKKRAALLEQIEKIRPEIVKSEGMNRTISYSMDHVSDEAQDDFSFYLENARKRAMV